jgi:hypothetical protein
MLIEHNVDGARGKVEEHAIYYWDQKQLVFKALRCDNTAPECSTGTGRWEDGVLVMRFPTEIDGKKYERRERNIYPEKGTARLEVDLLDETGELTHLMSVEYSRSEKD